MRGVTLRWRQRVQADPVLSEPDQAQVRHQVHDRLQANALVDFPLSDPIEIIKRLMIGSEGTLGFVSAVAIPTTPSPSGPTRCRPLLCSKGCFCLLRAAAMHAPVNLVRISWPDPAPVKARRATLDVLHDFPLPDQRSSEVQLPYPCLL